MSLRAELALFCFAVAAQGEVLHVYQTDRSDVLGGRSFGSAGPYERIVGKVLFGLDPTQQENRIIVDLEKAPRNAKGLVECSADVYVLKPRDSAKGNGTVLFEVSNRGGKSMLRMYDTNAANGVDPRTDTDFGDAFLLEQGYTIVWLGWQFDVPRGDGRLVIDVPVAKGVTGQVRAEYVADRKQDSFNIADRTHIPYPVVKPISLTMRDTVTGPRRTISADKWKVVDNGMRLSVTGGLTPGKIYEFIYESKDPAIVGLGPAAVRDFISFLKYGGNETLLNDQRRYIKRAYAFGVSQSGRFLRKFLYDGFNADEKNRKVFDGMLVHVAGAGRGSFNHRFAQPSRDGHPFMNTLYPTDVFPFTDLPETDAETSDHDALLAKAIEKNVVPYIFYTNSSYEYWGRVAALTHVSPEGRSDVTIPGTSRIYFFAGGQHGPAAFPPKSNGTQNLPNPNPYTMCMRALLVAMDKWVRDGTKPPDSVYPKIGNDTLVSPGALNYPKSMDMKIPQHPKLAYRADFTVEPPKVGKAFAILVPQVGADGNEIGGIKTPEVQIPLAVYTGWNLRKPELGAPDEMYSMVGSWIPYSKDEIVRRYGTRDEYRKKVQAAADDLVKRGFVLDRDAPRAVDHAMQIWDYLNK